MPHPIYQGSVVSTDGTKVILHFDQPLSTDTASVSDFILEVDGGLATIDAVSVSDDHVELTLQTAIQSGQTVAVFYTDPTDEDDDYAIQSSSSGDDADSFSDEYVTNDSEVTGSPGSPPPSGEFPIAFGSSAYDEARSITKHPDGSATITGLFSDTASFGDISLTANGEFDAFVAHISSDGTVNWARNFGGTHRNVGFGVSATSDYGTILLGEFNGGNTASSDNTIDLDSFSLTSAGDHDIFIAKVDADGDIVWANSAGGTGFDRGYAITSLDDGSSIITGHFFDTATFGDITLAGDADGDIFIAKLDVDGDFVWATKADGTGYGYGFAVSGYADDSLIVTGGFVGTKSFGDDTLTSASSTNYDVFIARLRSDGSFEWANSFGSSSHDVGADVVSLDDGGALVSGYFHNTVEIGGTTLTSAGNQDIYIAKVNSDGTYAWVTQAGGSTQDFSGGIGSFSDGSSIVTGRFTGTATFGDFSLTSQGEFDVYVAKLDDLGNFLWVQQAGGTEADGGSRLITHSDGSATIVGNFKGTADFGNYQLTSSGDVDGFVAVIDSEGNWVSALATDASVAEESSAGTPVFQYASTSSDGTRVILTYDQNLDDTDTAAPTDFYVDVDGNRFDVSYVMVYGSDIELKLDTAIQKGQTVTLDYTDPTEGSDDTYAIQSSIDGSDAASLNSETVTNLSEVEPPVLQSATTTIDGTRVILTYDQDLAYDTAAPADFTVNVNGSPFGVIDVVVAGFDIELVLATAIQKGQVVTLDYTDPTEGSDDSYAIQSSSDGTDAASFNSQSVNNASDVAPPVLQSARTSSDGLNVILTYDLELDHYTAAPADFSVSVNGSSVNVIDVIVDGFDVVLTLETPIRDTQSVKLDYTDPTVDDDDYAIQGLAYRLDATSLTDQAVTNLSELDGTPPSVVDLVFPWPHVRGVVGGAAPGFDISVTDSESTITLLEITFVSPDGTDEVTVDIDTYSPSHGTQNIPGNTAIYRKSWSIPESGPPGSIQGGFWTIKNIRVKDSSDNERIYANAELPSNTQNAGFWVNNEPASIQSIVGIKRIGQILTINPDTIADPDIDNLPAGSFTPVYSYQWQVSDNGADGWQDVSLEADYLLREEDANKYFRSIVSYDGKDGVITETLVSEPFKFTEYAVSPTPLTETFDSDNGGWVYADDSSVGIANRGDTNNYLGHLDRVDQVKKTFNLPNEAYKIGLDFLKFNSWDSAGHNGRANGDTFSVQIDDQVLFTYRPNGDTYVSRPGDDTGYTWTLTQSTDGLSEAGVRYSIDIDLPNPVKDFDLQVNLDIDQTYEDEWGGVDNVRIYQEIPISGPEAAPIFSSSESATTVEKDGPGTVVYQADAEDQSRFTYSLEGADPNLFSIDSTTGAVQLLEDAHYATRDNYNFTVRATDVFGNFADQNVSLDVEDSSLSFWNDDGYVVDSVTLLNTVPSENAVILKDTYNRVLSDSLSRSWNGVGVIKSNDGYRLLQIGERGRTRGQYRIAELNSSGILQKVGPWLSQSKAVANGYQELFELDLNGDGLKGLPVATDSDSNGFADGLGHYHLMGASKNVDFKGRRGTILSARSSRVWDALMAKETNTGFDVLIQGRRGRFSNKYQVWKTDQDGTVLSNGRWMNHQTLIKEGYETSFGKDLDGDGHVGTPPSVVAATDNNNDGFVDGLGHYKLKGPTPADAVDFKGRRGTILSARSSRNWDALMANAKGDGTGFDVLIQGTRGRTRGKYQVWQTDTNGTVKSNGRWMNLDTLVDNGYELIFQKDLNGDGDTGSPNQLGFLDANGDGLVDGITNYTLFKTVSQSFGQAIDLTDRRGRNLSDRSSRHWNAIKAIETSDGDFKVLIQGERGRRRSQYQVWTADNAGLITDQSRWLSSEQLAGDGYDILFDVAFGADGSATI